jgi:hypothetical protein
VSEPEYGAALIALTSIRHFCLNKLMTSPSDILSPDPSDDTLVRYLLGRLPGEQSEALDERSIVDAAFAERLRAIEHDLADAYVRGELSPDERLRWERTCGASAAGQDQVRLADALARAERRRTPIARLSPAPRSVHRMSPRALGLAAAAALALLIGAGYVLRRDAPSAESVAVQPTPAVPVGRSPTPSPPASGGGPPSLPSIVALTLAAPTRSLSDAPVLSIPAGTTDARLTLLLEAAGFSRYAVDLRDLASGRIVWRVADLVPAGSADGPALTVTVPANAFHSGRFALDVYGADSRGGDLIGTYPLRVDVKKP